MLGLDDRSPPPLPQIQGKVAYVFEEEGFDVDQIIGVNNIKITDPARLAEIAMEAIDPAFRTYVSAGDVIVGNHNFGYGHPHMPPMAAMRALGVVAVIAESFAPGYWREEMAAGFPQITCPGILDLVRKGDRLKVDWPLSRIVNTTSGLTAPFEPFSDHEIRMLIAGGHLSALKRELEQN